MYHTVVIRCVCQRGGNERGCAPAGGAGPVLLRVLAGVVSRASNSGQASE